MLRKPKLEAGIDQRAQSSERAVSADTAVAEANGQVRARLEALCVGEIVSLRVLSQYRHTGKYAARQLIEVVPLQRAAQDGIEARDDRADAQRRANDAAGACARAPGSGAG